MKTNLIISLNLTVLAAFLLTAIGIAYAEHQPRPNHAEDTIDSHLDDSCPQHPGEFQSDGRACDGLKKANNAATK